MSKSQPWSQIIKTVSTPLSFFVLTLLIIESTLALVIVKGDFDAPTRWAGFLWMVGLFVCVVAFVAALTVIAPERLLYGKEEILKSKLERSALRDQIEDVIVATVKPDCLRK
jgi:hypothetical protein